MMHSAAPAELSFGDADYSTFQQKVFARTGIRLVDYKSDQMRRRICTMAQQTGSTSYVQYFTAMEQHPDLLTGFLDKMTINVTELFRNPDRFEDLRRLVLPGLLHHRKGEALSVWSAGCSYGAEAYSVAMLLHEESPRLPHRITGTDIDVGVLTRAAYVTFSASDMANVSPARRAAFFQEGSPGAFLPSATLRSAVHFGRHDLLADHYPSAEYDLIVCRNVLIYFTESAKVRIFQGFFRALRPGGVLFVGGTEHLNDNRTIGFHLEMPFFYRKPK